jgi:hypothetical protein
MRTRVSLTAPGNTAWVPVSDYQNPFSVSLFVNIASSGTATYTVQHTPDDPQGIRQAAFTQAGGTTVTVTDAGPDGSGHHLNVGDSVQCYSSGDPAIDGPQTVATVVDSTHYTLTVVGATVTASPPTFRVVTMRVYPHQTLAALTAKANDNYAFPVRAIRLSASAVSGSVELEIIQGAGR